MFSVRAVALVVAIASSSGCFLFPDEDEIDFGFKGASSAENTSDTVIRLTWSASTAERVFGYNVYTVSGGSKTLIATIETPGTTSYDHAGLTSGNAYSYNVQAYDEDGFEDGNSAQVTAIPYGGIVSATALSKESAKVSYSAASGAASLRVYCKRDQGGESLLATEASTSTSVTLTKLNAGSSYECRVSAVTSTGSEDKNTATASFSLPYAKGVALTGSAAPTAGSCEGPYTVKINDQNGSSMTMTSAATVTLSTSFGKLYDSSKCSTVASTVSISSGGASADYYFSSTATGSATITASHAGLSSTLALSVAAASASQVSIEQSSSNSNVAGDCLAYTSSIRDAYSNLAPGSADRTVSLTSSQSTGSFYSDSGCSSAASSRTVASGASQAAFYYKQTAAGNATLSGSSTSLTTGTLAVAVTARPPAALSLGGSAAPSVGSCVAYTLTFVDSAGNATSATSAFTASFSGAGSGAFYASDGCSSASSSTSVAVGASSATVYYKNSVSEGLTLAAAASGLTSGTKAISLSPGSTSQIAVSYSAPITANTCVAVTGSYKDGYGNATPISSVRSTTIALAANSAKAYSDSGCSVTTAARSSSINDSTVTFYFKDTVAENTALTMSSSGLADGTAIATVVGASFNSLTVSASGTQMPKQCAPITMTTYDVYSNAPTHSGLTVTLSGAGSGTFYSDSACASSATTGAIASGVQAVTVYLKDNSTETVTLSGVTGSASSTKAVTVAPGTATQLTLTGGSGEVYASYCSSAPFTLTSMDAYTNTTNVASNTAVTFSGLRAAEPYAASYCMGSVLSAVTIASGSSSITFHLGGTNRQSGSFTLSSGSLTPATASVTLRIQAMAQSGYYANCILLGSGNVKCYGYQANAQSMENGTNNVGDAPEELGVNRPIVNLGTNRVALRLAASTMATGYSTFCALLDTKRIRCWGRGGGGAAGYESTVTIGDSGDEQGDNLPYVNVGTNATVAAIAPSYAGFCAMTGSGEIKCWGGNDTVIWSVRTGYGDNLSRGNAAGTMGDNLPSVNVGTGVTARDLVCGATHCCAITTGDQVKCWGAGGNGRIGLGEILQRGDATLGAVGMGDNLPYVNLGTGRTARSAALAYISNCVILDDHTTKCWGYGAFGELLNGATTVSIGDAANEMGDCLPTRNLGTGRIARQLSSGSTYGSAYRAPVCAVLDNGRLKCWGFGYLHGYGDNVTRGMEAASVGDSLAYVDVGTNRTVRRVDSGIKTCAILDDYTMKCWGLNDYGQLGYGDLINRGGTPDTMGDNLPAMNLGDNLY